MQWAKRDAFYISPSLTESSFFSFVIKTIIDLHCYQYIDYNQHQRTVIKVKYFL